MSRQINVTRTWVIKEGVGKKGPWALRGVEADAADGSAIVEQLKTFADIPHGMVEVDVERQDDERYGTSFLLTPVRGSVGSARSSPPSSAGAGELADMRARIERLESEVKRLSGLVDRREPVDPAAADGFEPAAFGGAGAFGSDDDIPF